MTAAQYRAQGFTPYQAKRLAEIDAIVQATPPPVRPSKVTLMLGDTLKEPKKLPWEK
jgi:hypothetical protein